MIIKEERIGNQRLILGDCLAVGVVFDGQRGFQLGTALSVSVAADLRRVSAHASRKFKAAKAVLCEVCFQVHAEPYRAGSLRASQFIACGWFGAVAWCCGSKRRLRDEGYQRI